MSPTEFRAWVLILTRDLVIPLSGVFLAVFLPISHNFQPWQLPLLAGMIGVPLVGRGGTPEPDPRGKKDPRPKPKP